MIYIILLLLIAFTLFHISYKYIPTGFGGLVILCDIGRMLVVMLMTAALILLPAIHISINNEIQDYKDFQFIIEYSTSGPSNIKHLMNVACRITELNMWREGIVRLNSNPIADDFIPDAINNLRPIR